MPFDKFSATWVSHSSISDYLKCPRSYYLKNVYKDPKVGRRISLMNPALALGQVLHEVIDCLYQYKKEERVKVSLIDCFNESWKKVEGKKGGFLSDEEEQRYQERGLMMIRQILENPGPLHREAVRVKINKEINNKMPTWILSEEDNVVLCGKVDWLEYEKEKGFVNIFDFKTGKHEEDEDSLQLPIYLILAAKNQRWSIGGMYYWYLDGESKIVNVKKPEIEESVGRVLRIAREIKKAREEQKFDCPSGGCFCCRPYQKIIAGEGEWVGVDEMRRDIYILAS